MSVEKYTKLETYKGIKKKKDGLESLFAELKFNKKKPKYNYWSGFMAGMLIRNLQWLQPLLASTDELDNNVNKEIFKIVIDNAKTLVNDYNWNMHDLNELASQFFGDK